MRVVFLLMHGCELLFFMIHVDRGAYAFDPFLLFFLHFFLFLDNCSCGVEVSIPHFVLSGPCIVSNCFDLLSDLWLMPCR